ncbi:MAG: PP2C family protein-serine/threonine phosphatase [Phycisphaerales bacterium JB038]
MDPLTGRLLVVDDNEMNRDMLSRRLARSGHEVEVAENGLTALSLVERERFDLVLLDVMMPGLDGVTVLRRIRERWSGAELPVIMATARDERGDIVEALRLGANDYVTKPLDFGIVQARVSTQLSLKRSVDQIRLLERDLAKRAEDLQRANDRMRRDLKTASLVQQALLPTSLPEYPNLNFAWAYHPCDELAGDTLGIYRLSDRHVGVFLVDVSGHGVASSLLAVTVSRMLMPVAGRTSLVREWRGSGRDPEPVSPVQVAEELNSRFRMENQLNQYFTMFYGVLDQTTGLLRYVLAGHPGPVAVPGGDEVRVHGSPAFAVGWFPEPEYEEQLLELTPGDRLYIFSDGIHETMNEMGEAFGDQRVASCLGSLREESLDQSLSTLVRAATRFSGREKFHDDVSALAIEMAAEVQVPTEAARAHPLAQAPVCQD